MKSFCFVLVLVVAAVVGLSFALGWWTFSSDSLDGKGHITVTVDKDKIQEDKKTALEKVHELGHPAKDKVAPAEPRKDQ
jgi:preprotein translocase subunit SecF